MYNVNENIKTTNYGHVVILAVRGFYLSRRLGLIRNTQNIRQDMVAIKIKKGKDFNKRLCNLTI